MERTVPPPKREVWECSVSLFWLFEFVNNRQAELNGLSTQDVVTKIVIPETAPSFCRYVDLLPSSVVSSPNYFASHVWNSPFLNLVDGLRKHFNLKEDSPECKSIFIWIDIFAVNQHPTADKTHDLQNLYTAIKKSLFGTLVCLDIDGALLTRIWCLYEIWQTVMLGHERLKIIGHQVRYSQLRDVFVLCDVAKAQATFEEDRNRILKEIQSNIGFSEMNNCIKKVIVESCRMEAEHYSKYQETDPDMACFSYEKYANLLTFIGNHDKALPLMERSLSIREKTVGSRHIDTAKTLTSLGNLLSNMRKYSEALPLFERALSIRVEKLGYENEDTANALNNLGLCLKIMKRYDEAMPLLARSLQVFDKSVGQNDSQTARPLNNLGLLLCESGKYAEALPLLERSLEIHEKCYGFEHPYTATSLTNLGLVYQKLKKYSDALPLYQRALAVYEKTLGSDHINTAKTLNFVALCLNRLKRYSEALPLCKKALEVLQKTLGPDHKTTVQVRERLVKIEYNNSSVFTKVYQYFTK